MSDSTFSNEDPVVTLIKQSEKLGLLAYLDLTSIFIDTYSKDVCVYIIKNFNIDTEQVKNLLDDEVDEELIWKLSLINEHEIELFGN